MDKLNAIKISKQDWIDKFSKIAHESVFGSKNEDFYRIDFAILVTTETDVVTYVTCREVNKETVLMSYGGSFRKNNHMTLFAVKRILDICTQEYKTIVAFVENTNFAMLRIFLKIGLKITGLRFGYGTPLVELTYDK